MSLEQAFTLLDKEVAQGLYKMPDIAKLTEREIKLQNSDKSVPAAFSMRELQKLSEASTNKYKYRGVCYRIPIQQHKVKLTMVCYLQNLRK